MIGKDSFPLVHIIDESEHPTEIHWHSLEHKNLIVHSVVATAMALGQKLVFVGQSLQIENKALFSDFTRHNKSLDVIHQEIHQFENNLNNSNDEWLQKLSEYDLITQDLCNQFRRREQVIFDSTTIQHVSELQHISQIRFPKEFLQAQLNNESYEFTYKEFKIISEQIQKATNYFEPTFRLLEKFNPFNQNIFMTEEGEFSTSVLLKYLSNFISKAELLHKSYTEFFSNIQHQNHRRFSRFLKEKFDALRMLNLFPMDESLKATRFQEIFESLVHSELDLSSRKLSEIQQISSLEIKINDTIYFVERSIRKVDNYNKSFLKSLNIRSYKDDNLIRLETELDKLVKAINDSSIFQELIENNSISSYMKFENLGKVLELLHSSRDQLILMGDFYTWKAFLAGLMPKISKVIQVLGSINKNYWKNAFESWYFYNMILNHRALEIEDDQEGLNQYMMHIETIESDFHSVLEALIFENRKVILNEFKKSNQTVFSKLTKKKQNISLDPSKSIDQNLLNTFYPIHFIQDITFQSPAENYVYLVLSDDLSNISELRALGAKYYTINASSSPLELIPTSHHTFISEPLNSSSIGQKLEIARFLASFLAKNTPNLKCYLNQQSNFIIDCSPYIQQKIEEIWNVDNLKQIRISTDASKSLTEFFLNESENGIYIYDHLSKIDKPEQLYLHTQFIKSLQNAGYHTFYIDTLRLVHEEDYLYDMIQHFPPNL